MDDLNPFDTNSSLNNRLNPGNSKKEERRRLKPVTNEKIVLKNKSLFRRIGDGLFAEDSGDIGEYLINDVIRPAIRDTIYAIVTDGLSMALYSKPGRRSGRNKGSGSFTSYDNYYNDKNRTNREVREADRYRTKIDIYNIPIPNPDVGYDALSSLSEQMMTYGDASVQDLYDALDIGGAPHTMVDCGWTDLSGAKVQRDRGDWFLRMPKPHRLK